MSVRVCYLERAGKGGLLRAVRLVGAASDERWPGRPGLGQAMAQPEQTPEFYARAAEWIRGRIRGPRSQETLELLCLDAHGSIFSWITTNTADPGAIATAARAGDSSHDQGLGASGQGSHAGSHASPHASMVEYFAPSDLESSVQALTALDVPKGESRRLTLGKPKARSDAPPQRAAVMAVADVPARLLSDALDDQGINPRSVATIWHALGQAWVPKSAAPASEDPLLAPSASVLTGVVMIEPEGRLVWSWSRDGSLVAGGAMRLLSVGGDDDPRAVCTPADLGRLASDWMGWSLQVGTTPRRVVCVLPTGLATSDGAQHPGDAGLDAGAICETIARGCGPAKAGLQVDAVVHDDPLGATLRALAQVLEKSPAPAALSPGEALVADSTRPNHSHRQMYVWASAALFLLAGGLALAGWSLHRSASHARDAAGAWATNWQPLAKEIFPAAVAPRPGLSAVDEVEDEIGRRTRSVPETFVQYRPALKELEAASLVVRVPGVRIEEMKFDTNGASISVAADQGSDKVRVFESLAVALDRVEGSSIADWTYTPGREDPQRKEIKAIFRGNWTPDAIKAAAKQLMSRRNAGTQTSRGGTP